MKSILKIEFFINVSPVILYPRLSNPGGLIEWFADDIRVKDDIYTFVWNGSESSARLLHKKKNNYIRFKWLDDSDDKSYFEFRIERDDLTGDVALIVTDFAEEEEKEDVTELWDKQVGYLKNALGCTG
jgi:hypothetical protein